MSVQQGRVCPLSYQHGPRGVSRAVERCAPALWVAGGLYGNVEAADALLAALDADRPGGERPLLVLNGDFHWFDADPGEFRALEQRLADHVRLAGNVEAELGSPSAQAGCGCAYPAFVDDATVARSNAIMERLQATVAELEGMPQRLAGLPRLLRVRVGTAIIGIIHGDPDSLAGWGLAVESLATSGGPTDGPRVREWARQAGVDGFACSHTCLPWMGAPGGIPVANNGSAGMPNFRGCLHGLATRIAPVQAPHGDAVYSMEALGLRFEAIPLHYDRQAWRTRFERLWPPGSPAHE